MEKISPLSAACGGEQQTVGGNSRNMRRAKQRGRMVKIKNMVKYENERNQKSWNGSSHTRGSRNKCCGRILQIRPETPADKTQGRCHSSAPKPGWKVTAKDRDWEYLVELVLSRPRPAPPLIGPRALKSMLSVKEGDWFSVGTSGAQNRRKGRVGSDYHLGSVTLIHINTKYGPTCRNQQVHVNVLLT